MTTSTKMTSLIMFLMMTVMIENVIGNGGQIPTSVLEQFATTIKGKLVLPTSSNYKTACQQWNSAYDSRRPQAVVYAAQESDVVAVVQLSLNYSASVSVRSGGHSFPGYAVCDGCVVIDMASLNQVQYFSDSKTVSVGPGTHLIEFTKAAAPYNITVPHGFGPSVAFGGFTLGGGVGLTHRRYGLTIDSLESVRIVLANGSLVTVSEQSLPDLFWALRGGGGGNFGVVTSYLFRASQVPPTVLYVSLKWSYSVQNIITVSKIWQEFFQNPSLLKTDDMSNFNPEDASRDFGLYWRIEGSPFGTWFYGVEVFGVWTGDITQGRQVIDKLVTLCKNQSSSPSKMDVEEVTYDAAFLKFMSPYVKVPRTPFKVKSRLVKNFFPPAAYQIFAEEIQKLHFLQCFPLLWLDPLGGKVSDVSPTDTAYPHRSAFANLVIFVFYLQEKDKQIALDWVNNTMTRLEPYLDFGEYVNFPDGDVDQWQQRYYLMNYDRLRAVKTTYDKDNFFSFPQSIEPLTLDEMTKYEKMQQSGQQMISIS